MIGLGDIFAALKNSLSAILSGKLLMRLGVDRYFVHVIYIFFLLSMIIWVSLSTETSLSKVEKNKAAINELEIEYTQKTYDIVRLSSRSSVATMLEKMGSDVKEATKPATVLE